MLGVNFFSDMKDFCNAVGLPTTREEIEFYLGLAIFITLLQQSSAYSAPFGRQLRMALAILLLEISGGIIVKAFSNMSLIYRYPEYTASITPILLLSLMAATPILLIGGALVLNMKKEQAAEKRLLLGNQNNRPEHYQHFIQDIEANRGVYLTPPSSYRRISEF